MSNRIAASIERGLRDEGLDVAARFRPAASRNEDAEIEFLTPGEDGLYPVFLQIIGISHASVCIRAIDGDNHGLPISRSHTRPLSDMVGIVDLLSTLIRDEAPIPVKVVSLGAA